MQKNENVSSCNTKEQTEKVCNFFSQLQQKRILATCMYNKFQFRFLSLSSPLDILPYGFVLKLQIQKKKLKE